MNNLVRILIVEDEGIVAFDLKRILERLNYTVIGVLKRGEDAIQKAVSDNPDLILMDIMLDGKLTGIQASQEIKKVKSIPVIYLTAYADTDTLNKAKITEPFGYILKPFDEKTLLSTIEMALFKHKLDMRLKESEERYRHLVELSPIGIAIVAKRKVVYVNPAAVKLFGASGTEDLLSRSVLDFLPRGNRSRIREVMTKVLQEQVSYNVRDEKLLTMNGTGVFVEYTVIPILYNGKKAAQIVLRDVTEERKRNIVQNATLRILQSANVSENLNILYSNIYNIINEIIPAKNLCIAFFEAGKGLLKYPFVSDTLDIYADRPFRNGLTEYVIKNNVTVLLTDESIKQFEMNNGVTYDESPVKAWLGVPLQIHEKTNGAIIIKEYNNKNVLTELEKEFLELLSFPISRAIEKILTEEQMKKYTSSLADLNESKDKFFSIISHDLKSPFNSILGYTELLKQEYDILSEDEKKIYIDSVYSSTRNLYNHINNLLEFSRFQSGRIDYNPTSIPAEEWLNRNIVMLSGILLKKDIKVKIDVARGIKFFADEPMADSIIQNLLTNAIKFSPRGSEINISLSSGDNNIELKLVDQGVGMSVQTLTSLFDINKKVTVPGTENEIGTGLGLILTKEFIEKNKGTIELHSVEKKGTTITVTFPCSPEH